MKILVISPCTVTQKHSKLPNKLRLADFQSLDRRHLPRRIEGLSEYKEPAAEMYKGREHKLLMEGIKSVREHNQYGKIAINWHIISTGYGLISECKDIVPYDVENSKSPILKDGKKLNKNIEKIIKNFDLVFFLLGKKYVKALRLLQLPFRVPETVVQIFVTYKRTKGYSHLIPKNLPNCNVVELNFNEFKSGYTAKGYVFKKLCEAACSQGFQVFKDVKDDPQLILDIVQ